MNSSTAPIVLNVDYDEPALHAKTRILRRAGFVVLEARDGTTALQLVARNSPQLVLLDVQLPDISGLEVCRRIKNDPATRWIPVLHISATDVTESDQQAGMESGAEICLVEPLAPAELITVVRTLLRLRQTEAGLAASEERLRLAKRADAERTDLLRRESAARVAAEDAARIRDQFLATLSHELRTPMSAVLGWLHLLRSGKLTAEQETQALETIERNARLQNQFINDLLDLSRMITGQLRIGRDKTFPSMILESTIDSVGPQASARRITLNLSLPRESVIVSGDPSRLQQVFTNLLVNAIKFSPGGSEIDITMRCVKGAVQVEFVDRGEGIAPEMLPLVFERFRRADGSITRRRGGMGLGLAIARHILDLHGGSVVAASEGPGKGATFTVTLPRLEDVERALADDSPGTRVADLEYKPLSGLHVLAVDDDVDALAMLASMLELGGARVSCAGSAEAAIDMFCAASDIAVLLSDIGMPNRDGCELIETLRRDFPARAAEVAAIAITGYALDEDHARALRAGFDAHLAKPYGMHALFEAIAALVRRRQGGTPERPAHQASPAQ